VSVARAELVGQVAPVEQVLWLAAFLEVERAELAVPTELSPGLPFPMKLSCLLPTIPGTEDLKPSHKTKARKRCISKIGYMRRSKAWPALLGHFAPVICRESCNGFTASIRHYPHIRHFEPVDLHFSPRKMIACFGFSKKQKMARDQRFK
jgi:hypothetical protein